MCFQILRQSTSGQIAKAMMPTGLHLKRLPYASMIPPKTMIYMHDEVCVGCKGQGPSQIPPSFQNPLGTCCSTQGRSWTAWNAREKLVGRGTVERPWFLSRFSHNWLSPRNGTLFTAGESGVYWKLREFGFWNGVAGQTNSWSLETIPLSLDSSKALPKKKVSKTSETWKFWGSWLDLLKREWFEAFPSMRNNGNPANQSCWLCL
jgi:hypothetical protein